MAIVIPNLIFFCYWIWNMILEILKMIIVSNKIKVFRIVTCGLVDEDKF